MSPHVFRQVCNGEWYASDATSGVLITSLADANNLRLSTFVGGMMTDTVDQVGTSSHRLTSYTRLRLAASNDECHQFDSGHSLVAGAISFIGVVFVSLFW
jgi:hypothetical protein